jgi:CheY-like chemotaxis protein
VRPQTARVLIIDEDEAVRSATKIALAGYGFDVVAVTYGKSGIAAIQDRQFDVVIVDLFMPRGLKVPPFSYK